MDAVKTALKNTLDQSKTPGGITLDIIIGKDGKVSGESSHGGGEEDGPMDPAQEDETDMAPELNEQAKPGMEDPGMTMKNNLGEENALNEQIVRGFADSSSPGRGAMGLHERAAQNAKEKLKGFAKK